MNRSQNAARYGALAERRAAERYGLELERDDWHDARGPRGRPWDVKAAMASRRSARFRLWEDQNRKLRQEGGGYVFVLYRAVGRGIQVQKMRSLNARGLRLEFYGAGNYAKGRQVKVTLEKVFN